MADIDVFEFHEAFAVSTLNAKRVPNSKMPFSKHLPLCWWKVLGLFLGGLFQPL